MRSKSIGLACSGKEIYHFCFVLLCFREQIPGTSPRGSYIRRGDLTEGFCVTILRGLYLEGLIHGGAYFRNFTVSLQIMLLPILFEKIITSTEHGLFLKVFQIWFVD